MHTQVIDRVDGATGEVVGTAVALVPASAFSMDAYLGAVANNTALHQQQQLAAAYDVACNSLVGPNDVQADGSGKAFKKKSAWRKLGRYFNISTQIVTERTERAFDTLTDREELVATVIVRAIAPWGQTAEALGKCSTREKRFLSPGAYQKRDADCPATAQTRATNRAISDLIAAGEVSAEEVEFGGGEEPHAAPVSRQIAAPRAPAAAPRASAPTGGAVKCPKCAGAMWDNRTERDGSPKRNPKAPDFKCKDATCGGVVWPPRDPKPAVVTMPANGDDEWAPIDDGEEG